jgi:pimeloyl-ACP methyl ester carboxylesterase
VVHGLEGRIAERLCAVVHLEGAIPAPGRSIMDGWPEDYRQSVLAAAAAHKGWRVPPDPGMWTGLDAVCQRWLRAKLTAQPLKTYQDVMPAGIGTFPGPHIYLWASDRPTQPYRAVVERFRHAANWQVVATTGGHELPLTNPEAVLRVIAAALDAEVLPDAI